MSWISFKNTIPLKAMKTTIKTILLVLFLFLTRTGLSQHYHYYNVGDTIRGRDSIYHYQWWSEQWLSDTSRALNVEAIFFCQQDKYFT